MSLADCWRVARLPARQVVPPDVARAHETSPHTACEVLRMALLAASNARGPVAEFWISPSHIADSCDLTTRTVERAVAALREAKAIEPTGRRGRHGRVVYRLLI